MAFGHSKSLQPGWAALSHTGIQDCWGGHLENAPESLKAGIKERIDEGEAHHGHHLSNTKRETQCQR